MITDSAIWKTWHDADGVEYFVPRSWPDYNIFSVTRVKDTGRAVHACAVLDPDPSYPDRILVVSLAIAFLHAHVLIADEGLTWLRGKLDLDGPEVQAMEAAYALLAEPSKPPQIRFTGVAHATTNAIGKLRR